MIELEIKGRKYVFSDAKEAAEFERDIQEKRERKKSIPIEFFIPLDKIERDNIWMERIEEIDCWRELTPEQLRDILIPSHEPDIWYLTRAISQEGEIIKHDVISATYIRALKESLKKK